MRVAKTFAGMQDTRMLGRAVKLEEIGGEEGVAQQLEQILASGLPPLYRRAYRIPGNTGDAEDAVQVRRTATRFRSGAAGRSPANPER
jgi:hypothetical protein